MKLSSYINQINQSTIEMPGNEGTSSLEQYLRNGMDSILGKQSGQSVAGEVIQISGNEILLSLGKNQLLQAKLEGNMSVQQGQMLTFQIRNNAGSKVVLSPLFENIGQDPNVSRALQQAGMPENSITVAMVKAMMSEGLPIDRQSLFQMNRLINTNPQVDIQTLVQMQRLSLPITPENITQFEAYKNYQHQLGEGLCDIADAFTQTFQEITGNQSMQEGLQFYQEVLNILTEKAEQPVVDDDQEQVEKNVTLKESRGMPRDGMISQPVTELLSREDITELTNALKQSGAPESLVKSMLLGKLSGNELLAEVGRLLSEDEAVDKEALFKLLDGKEFKQVLKNEMNRQWLLMPEEVAEENSVDKLYERLNNQIKQLQQALSQTVKSDTPLAKTVANVSGNIEFMNQLNQMFTYVQLPLKMQNQSANGELFVYTNKKSLAKKDGTVSALLHLDMEHLGSIDVHISLTEQKVATKFYLKDDSALDLIEANIDLLNNRLNQRGYSVSAQFLKQEEDGSVMDEILKQNKNVSILAGYSFDARA
ncbi:MAG: flagellar hook-length control protein FliK [Lachnospiraceae bacterium]|nr:flagellar hook-length control protein FliK [Lachnospiraceae bacterium]